MSKILLIDDYKTSRDLLQDLLQKRGYQVDPAKDGEEGYQLAQQSAYDLILVDLVLPRTSAYSLIQQLLRHSSPVPPKQLAILYTVGSENLLEPIKELGITNFILKSTTNQDAIISQVTNLCPLPSPP